MSSFNTTPRGGEGREKEREVKVGKGGERREGDNKGREGGEEEKGSGEGRVRRRRGEGG